MEQGQKTNTTVEVLAKAIRRRSVVSFTYRGNEQLVVEPIVLGVYKETKKETQSCRSKIRPGEGRRYC